MHPNPPGVPKKWKVARSGGFIVPEKSVGEIFKNRPYIRSNVMRNVSIIRQWKILLLLGEGPPFGVSADMLSKRLKVPIRTIYRDLEALKSVFSLGSYKDGNNSFWFLAESIQIGKETETGE